MASARNPDRSGGVDASAGVDPSTPRKFPLEGRELEEVLALCDMSELRSGAGANSRKSMRIDLRGLAANARVMQPGGGVNYWQVRLLDISDGGAGFIYPGFLHVGTRLVLTLRRVKGGHEVAITGQVLWCRFLRKQFHAVGVRWDEKIETREFVNTTTWLESVASNTDVRTMKLSGRLIHLSSSDLETSLVQMHLSDSGLTLMVAPDSGALLDQIRRQSADILLLDVESMGADPCSVLRAIRRERYCGPIIVATPPGGPGGDTLRVDGGVEVLTKPVMQDTLVSTIRSLVEHGADQISGTRPMYSAMSGSPEKHEWILQFINLSRRMSRELLACIANDDTERALKTCQSLSVTGAGYGFPVLAEAAGQAVRVLNATGSANESGPEIRSVVFLIDRLRVAPVDEAA